MLTKNKVEGRIDIAPLNIDDSILANERRRLIALNFEF